MANARVHLALAGRMPISLEIFSRLTVGIVLIHGSAAAADAPITAASISADGQHLILGSQAGLFVRQMEHLASQERLTTQLENIHDVAFSPDGSRFVAAGGTPEIAGAIEVWKWPERQCIARLELHSDLIYGIAWRDDGRQLACASADTHVSLIDADQWQLAGRWIGHSRAVTAVTYLPGGESLVSASEDESLRVWNSGTRTLIRSLTNHTGGIRDVLPRPVRGDTSAPLVASIGRDRTVRLWHPLTGRMLRFLRLPAEPTAFCWDVQGDRLIVASVDGMVRVIRADTLEILREFAGIEGRTYELIVAREEILVAAGTGAQVRTLALPPR